MSNYQKYPVKQLKTILRKQLSELKQNPKIGAISKLKKKEVLLLLSKYNITYFPPIEKNAVVKKNIIKSYNEDEQEQFLNKGYNVINPLKSKGEYFNLKSGKNEIVELLEHQEKFLRKFFLSNVSGSIVFHGVGTGKSLTAAAASHYYLSLNPDGHIVFVSPPALILNFINALKQYGLDEKDKRYSFYSFEKFSRNPNIENKKCLFIVDEAHILRTEINAHESVNENQEKVIQVSKNKRGYAVLEAIKKIDKCILLTGTPFINKLYDIENLLSMVVKKDPLDQDNFANMITNTNSRHDYFRYKISHYENETGSKFFPKKIQEYIPLIMNEEELKRYESFERGNTDILEDEELENIIINGESEKSFTSFYNGTRQYSNLIDYKKINFIIDRIKNKKTTGQFIIYTTFINNGVDLIKKYLNKNNIEFAVISGKENIKQKEDSKNKYNNKDVQVLIITKAGTEGIDTIGTEAIFIYEGSSWNEALVEQAIARAIRFKSHFHLPKNQQIVYVYRLLIVKSNDEDTINKINKNEIFNFGLLLKKYKQISNQIKERQKIEAEKEDEKIDFEKSKYKNLSKEEKQKYLDKVKYERYHSDKQISKLFKQTPSVEARLTILSLAKKQQILEFIKELDTQIQQLEDYETKYEKEVHEKDIEDMTEKEILELQKKYINGQKEDILKKINSSELQNLLSKYEEKNHVLKSKLDIAKRYQAYFTPETVIKMMLQYSQKLKTFEAINILEPTAGIGNIPIYMLQNYKKDYKIHMVEIQEENRKVLKNLCNDAPDILELYETKDFLQFVNPIEYDLIVMNPPFHLRKSQFTYLDRDYYDMDFVFKCYYMLENKGELIALCGQITDEKWKKWIKENNGEIINFEYKNWTDKSKKSKEEKKATTIKRINLSIVVMYRNKTNTKQEIKERNKALDPDLNNNQETMSKNIQDFFYNIRPRY